MGLTTKGSIGARTARTLDDCVELVQDINDPAFATAMANRLHELIG